MLRIEGGLNEHTLDWVLRRLPKRGAIEIDLGGVEFVDPHGMVALLELGRSLARDGRTATLHEPDSDEVHGYLERMRFWIEAEKVFRDIEPPPDPQAGVPRRASDVLLEATRIERSSDVNSIVSAVRARAGAILSTHLGYDDLALHRFLSALSEVCQNVPEHSGDVGYVAIQKYRSREKERNFVKIGVSDLGEGIRRSLERRLGRLPSDLDAIEKAALQGVSRYADTGRGQGLAAVRRMVEGWKGRLGIRSGTARVSLLPPGERGDARESGLPFFPGTQVCVTLPALR